MNRTTHAKRRPPWLRIRVGVYLLIATVVLLLRMGSPDRPVFRPLPGVEESGDTLVVAGADAAPELVSRIVNRFRRIYPDTPVRVATGSSAAALEGLGNRAADAVFLSRPPTRQEQEILAAALGDTVLWFPVALGAIVLLLTSDASVDSLSLPELAALARGGAPGPFVRLYAPDPNTGLWDAFVGRIAPDLRDRRPGRNVVFLADDAAVARAVSADPAGLGLASSFHLDETGLPPALRRLRVAPDVGAPAFAPEYADIGYGRYPLHHNLVVACRARGGILASMFVTWVTSDPGQRWIERSGRLPARIPLREIHLSREPVGAME